MLTNFVHWRHTFDNLLAECGETAPDKLHCLSKYVSATVYDFVADVKNFDSTISLLENHPVKKKNAVFPWYKLATRRQQDSQSLDEFLQALHWLAKWRLWLEGCLCWTLPGDLIRDAFINRLSSHVIRQRLLGSKELELKDAFDQAGALESVQQNSGSYGRTLTYANEPQPVAVTAAIQNSLEGKEVTSQGVTIRGGKSKKPVSFAVEEFISEVAAQHLTQNVIYVARLGTLRKSVGTVSQLNLLTLLCFPLLFVLPVWHIVWSRLQMRTLLIKKSLDSWLKVSLKLARRPTVLSCDYQRCMPHKYIQGVCVRAIFGRWIFIQYSLFSTFDLQSAYLLPSGDQSKWRAMYYLWG